MSEFLASHNMLGIAIGICTFLIIGIFHPLVIKGEYYLGQKANWFFLIGGIIAAIACVLVKDAFWQSLLGVTSCSCFWSILEVRQQRERVRKGWYPARRKQQ